MSKEGFVEVMIGLLQVKFMPVRIFLPLGEACLRKRICECQTYLRTDK